MPRPETAKRHRRRLTTAGRALACLAALVLATLLAGRAAAQEPNRAGLVVTFGDGTTATYCIEFDTKEISGADLLRASGLPLVLSGYSGLGAAVCRIGPDGCDDPADCFCRCRGGDCAYWSYYHLTEAGTWERASVGASAYRLHDGDVDGWAWGPGDVRGGAEPARRTFAEVCPSAPLAQPTPSPLPTFTAPPPTAEATPELPVPAGTSATATVDAAAVATAALAPSPDRPATEAPSPEARFEVAGAAEADDGGPGVPAGLIAFSAVAGALALLAGLLLARRFGHGRG